jgi:hypothetical protein
VAAQGGAAVRPTATSARLRTAMLNAASCRRRTLSRSRRDSTEHRLLAALVLCAALTGSAGCRSPGPASRPPTRAPAQDARSLEDALIASGSDSGGPSVPWTAFAPPERCRPPEVERLTVVASEDEFRRGCCQPSGIDWSRFRLVMVWVDSNHSNVSMDDVVRDGQDYVLVLQRFSTCSGAHTFMFEGPSFFAVLIPAGSEWVKVMTQMTPAPYRCRAY